MVSSAVSSVSYLRDAAGEHTATRMGSYVYYGGVASFYEWKFRARLPVAGTTGDHHIEAVTKVCDHVEMPSLPPKKLCPTPPAKSSMVLLAARQALNTNRKNCIASTVVQEDRCQDNKAKV